ncbi:unnamed protein product [Cladocopium goreaui]|uniref:Uncharacterized protein n=1 Tax=Cladocopium goreaui TaxID=2562237 RepID=A0A9P1CC30_9DINO|nr:unnamed protein product [Cladocopium goreaui]
MKCVGRGRDLPDRSRRGGSHGRDLPVEAETRDVQFRVPVRTGLHGLLVVQRMRIESMEVLSEDMIDQLRMMEEEMQDIASSLHPIDYLDAVVENICDVSGACADLFESMVLILSLSLIIGARDANSCCGAVLLHLFATVDRGRWKFGLHFGRSSKPCPESLHLEAGAMVHAGELAVRRCVCATGADPGELLRVRYRRHHHRGLLASDRSPSWVKSPLRFVWCPVSSALALSIGQ